LIGRGVPVKNRTRNVSKSSAFRFVLTMGVVALVGDNTYSGRASMNGLLLGSLGASAAIISIAGGTSEFLNYLTRGISAS
jgi:hypothetical protein